MIYGKPNTPSPSLQTERPGLGGARWEPGAHRSQHTQPGAACPPLMNRQSRPPGGRGQALPLVNLRGHSQPESQSSQAPMAGSPRGPGLGSRLLLRPGICHRGARHKEPTQDPRNRLAAENLIHIILLLQNEEESAGSNQATRAGTCRMGYIHHSWVHAGLNWKVLPFCRSLLNCILMS